MNKLMELINSFISIFKKNQSPEQSVFGAEEEYDGWLGI